MRYDYITKDEHLIEGLNRYEFVRKNKNCFSRETDDCILSIDFIHSVPRPKVKDYNMMISIEYPKAVWIGKELDVFTVGRIGANIGYLSPLDTYKVWRIEDIDDEKFILTIIDDMLFFIEKYALPFFMKYSILDNIIHEIEVGNKLFTPGSDYNLPIFYLLNNEKAKALSFLKKELKRKERKFLRVNDDYPIPNQIIIEDTPLPTYRTLNEYKIFVSKFVERFS